MSVAMKNKVRTTRAEDIWTPLGAGKVRGMKPGDLT
jgi:hypothetical protein